MYVVFTTRQLIRVASVTSTKDTGSYCEFMISVSHFRFVSFLVMFLFFFLILGRVVDYAGLTASFRAHINIVSLLTYLLTCLSLKECLQ